MLRQLLDKVRVQGHVKVDGFMRSSPPVIYTGEVSPSEPNARPYYNSGGRSLIFETPGMIYRIKGVDPTGKLTERVANSPQNRIDDVVHANEIRKANEKFGRTSPLMFNDQKPFGPFLFEQADKEMQSFQRLSQVYNQLGLPNPCAPLFYKKTGIEIGGEPTYQTFFRLPQLGSDLRVLEFMELLTARLDQCTTQQIREKSKNISRLFGRFIYWAGVNTGILAASELLPTKNSFVPQNWVISPVEKGYGLFRVDHTSTEITDHKKVLKTLMEGKHGVPDMVNNFSVFPSRVQLASNPIAFMEPDSRRFSDVLVGRPNHVDERFIIGAHKNVFDMGLSSIVSGQTMPIPKEMFEEALA
jgi:hypothetical protein